MKRGFTLAEVKKKFPRLRVRGYKAFTFAEILIILGVIGVIAAMTMPVLVSKIQQHILINKWRKAYNDINRAYTMVQAKEDLSGYYNCTENYCFQPVINLIVNEYVTKKSKGRVSSVTDRNKIVNYKTILGAEMNVNNIMHAGYEINDTLMYFWTYTPNGMSVWVDVNGYKKPNVLGKDLLVLNIYKNKITPYGQGETEDWCSGYGSQFNMQHKNLQPVSNKYYAGIGCSYKYLYDN